MADKLYALQTAGGIQTFKSPEEAEKWIGTGMNRFLLLVGTELEEIGVDYAEQTSRTCWVGVDWIKQDIIFFGSEPEAEFWENEDLANREIDSQEIDI